MHKCQNNGRDIFFNILFFYNFLHSQTFTYISLVFGSIALKRMTWVRCFRFPSTSVLQSFAGLLVRTSAHRCSLGLRSGLCDGPCVEMLSLSHFVTNLEVCLGSVSIWKSHLHPSFNFWCLSEVHQSLLQQNTFTSWCCHPRASELGWCPQKNKGLWPCVHLQTVVFIFAYKCLSRWTQHL